MERIKPGIQWYININRLRVMEDLDKHPEIIKALGKYYETFIKWAGNQRFNYDENIQEEYKEFMDFIINKKLYDIDYKSWEKISKEVFERDNYTCSYCGKVGGILEIDHIIPISKNGTNHLNNLTTACRKCNRQKKDKTAEEFNKWKRNKNKESKIIKNG